MAGRIVGRHIEHSFALNATGTQDTGKYLLDDETKNTT